MAKVLKQAPRYSKSCHHNTYHAHQLNQNVEAGARSILKGVTNGVANDGSFVCRTTLATKVAFFNEFLCVVPCATCICHKYSEYKTSAETTNEQSKYARYAKYDTCQDGYGNSNEKALPFHVEPHVLKSLRNDHSRARLCPEECP